MANRKIPEWLRQHLANGGMAFPGFGPEAPPPPTEAQLAAQRSGVYGVGRGEAPTTLGSEDLNRFTSYFVGQDPLRATAPMIGLEQTPATYGRANFYGDLGTARTRAGDIYGQQQTLAGQLAARARGEGQSLAELQLQRTLEENQRKAQGAIGSIRGMNPALAQRLLLNQQSAMQQQAAGQGALLRAQEQIEAQKALGSMLGGMRGAEGEAYQAAGQLGLGQEKLGVQTQETARERELKQAIANQQAELDRQRIEVQSRKAADESSFDLEGLTKAAGNVATAAASGKAAGLFGAGAGGGADGGSIPDDLQMADGGKMSKAQVVKAHDMAKKILESKEFRKRYGDRAKNVAYAIGMKRVQMAEGGHLKKGDPDTYITKEGKETRRGLWANVYLKRKREGKADGGEMHLTKLDDKKNDVIPAMLSEGEAVIPRSIMASSNPPEKAALFLKALAKKKSPKEAKKMALGGKMHMDKMKEMEMRIKELEAALGRK